MDDLPPEVRQAMEDDPELAAQIQEAIESGQIPPGAFGPPGGAAGGGQGAPGFAGGGATALIGAVVSFADETLRLETAEGEAELAVAPDTPVNVTMAPADAGAYLAEGSEVTVAAQTDQSGALAALAVFAGPAPDELTQAPGLAGFVTIITGTVEAFADGTLTVAGEDGATDVGVGDQTLVMASLTAADAGDELAEGASVTVFVERGADGGLSATSIEIGGAGGGFGGGPFGGGGFGGGAFGGGATFGAQGGALGGQGGAFGQIPGAGGLPNEASDGAERPGADERAQRRIVRRVTGSGPRQR